MSKTDRQADAASRRMNLQDAIEHLHQDHDVVVPFAERLLQRVRERHVGEDIRFEDTKQEAAAPRAQAATDQRDKCRCPPTHHFTTCRRHLPGIPSQCGYADSKGNRCCFDEGHEGEHTNARAQAAEGEQK
jgi:hypothetical protein